MSKAFRKLINEKAEQSVLDNNVKDIEEEYKPPPKKNMFAMGFCDSSSEEEEENESQDKIKTEQEDQDRVEDILEKEIEEEIPIKVEKQPIPSNKPKKKNKKKKKKKKKSKNNKENDNQDEEEKEVEYIDILADIYQGPINVLEIRKNFLNYNKEMNRYFKGQRLVDGVDESNLSKRQRSMLKMQRQRFKPKKKYYLVHNDDVFAPLPDKLILQQIKTNEFGHKVYAFQPTPRFTKLAETYEGIRNTHDPNNVSQFVQTNPFYPEAVYDFAEFLRLQGNIKEANKLLEQLLFLYEESIPYDFNLFNASFVDKQVLDFEHNRYTRIFFRAIFKMISILTKKGCYQASLEYNKLLLRLNPAQDPLGSLLYIDHSALSAKKYEYFKDFALNFGSQYLATDDSSNKSILLYPNIIYSLALSTFNELLVKIEESGNIRSELTNIPETLSSDIREMNIHKDQSCFFWLALAVCMYPKMIASILELTELEKQNPSHSKLTGNGAKPWKSILSSSFMMRIEQDYHYFFLDINTDEDIEGIEKVIQIYPQRNRLLWRNNYANLWMKATVGFLLNEIESGSINSDVLLESFMIPPQEGETNPLTNYCLPFEPSQHKKLIPKEFSDATEVMDLQNIPDEGPLIQEGNPVNMDQNLLGLFVNSFMPWNDLPAEQQNNNQNQILSLTVSKLKIFLILLM